MTSSPLALSFALALAVPAAVAATPTIPTKAVAGYHVSGAIPGPDGGWDYARVDPASRRLFVAHGNRIMAVDLRTATPIEPFASARHAHAVLPIPNSHVLLETDGDSASVRLIDTVTGSETARIAVGKKPDAAIWDDRRQRAVVVNAASGTVMLVDPATAKVERTVTLEPGLEYAAFDPAGRLYVNNEDGNDVSVVDLDKGTRVARIALPGCDGPTGMAFAPLSGRIVSTCGNGVAILIDPAATKVSGRLTIGAGADAAFVDSVRHMVFVPGGADGTLSLFRDTPRGLVPAGTLATEKGARTGAVDAATGRVYLPTATAEAPAAPGAKRSYRPGSFHLLIISPAG